MRLNKPWLYPTGNQAKDTRGFRLKGLAHSSIIPMGKPNSPQSSFWGSEGNEMSKLHPSEILKYRKIEILFYSNSVLQQFNNT